MTFVSLKMFNMNYEYKERDNRSTAPDFDLRRGAKPVFFGGVVFVVTPLELGAGA